MLTVALSVIADNNLDFNAYCKFQAESISSKIKIDCWLRISILLKISK